MISPGTSLRLNTLKRQNISDEEITGIMSKCYEKLQEFDVLNLINNLAGSLSKNETNIDTIF